MERMERPTAFEVKKKLFLLDLNTFQPNKNNEIFEADKIFEQTVIERILSNVEPNDYDLPHHEESSLVSAQ